MIGAGGIEGTSTGSGEGIFDANRGGEEKNGAEEDEEREEENETMRRELVQMRKDREDIRARVEKMLGQMDSLTHEQAAS